MTSHISDLDFSDLSSTDRLLLAQELLDSVLAEAEVHPLNDEQLAELDRRCAAIDRGESPCVAWDSVRDHFLSGK